MSAGNLDAVDVLDRWPAESGGALALIGPPGSGKTHLACAWAERVGASILRPDDLEVSAGAREAGPLLLEDADRLPAGESVFHLLNHAGWPGACLLITGRTAPRFWPTELPDLRSRLNAVPVVELGEPDDQVLQGVLVKLFSERNIRPPQDLLAYLLKRMERSASAAEEIVRALDEASHEEHRAVSRGLARHLMSDERDAAAAKDL